MYLAEDRVRGKCNVNAIPSLLILLPFLDPLLGTRFEARWIMGSSLRQICVRRYRHTGSGTCQSVL